MPIVSLLFPDQMNVPTGAECRGIQMKKMLLATTVAVTMLSGAVQAGGLSPAVVEEVDVTEKPASSVSPLLILGLIILVGVLVSRNNDSELVAK